MLIPWACSISCYVSPHLGFQALSLNLAQLSARPHHCSGAWNSPHSTWGRLRRRPDEDQVAPPGAASESQSAAFFVWTVVYKFSWATLSYTCSSAIPFAVLSINCWLCVTLFSSIKYCWLFSLAPLTVCRVFTERAVGDNIHEEGLERNCFGAKKWGLSCLQYYHIVQSKN